LRASQLPTASIDEAPELLVDGAARQFIELIVTGYLRMAA
jgi:hypothetical protein